MSNLVAPTKQIYDMSVLTSNTFPHVKKAAPLAGPLHAYELAVLARANQDTHQDLIILLTSRSRIPSLK
jgi:hypothetical protein